MPASNVRSHGRIRCVGCGAEVPDIRRPTHPFIGASPGCFKINTEVMAREFNEWGYPDVHRLFADTYAAQHPGTPSGQSIQSVAVHLMALHCVLDLKYNPQKTMKAMREALSVRDRFVWLTPPETRGELTIVDVSRAKGLEDYEHIVTAWAQSVWHAWSAHHDTVRSWIRQYHLVS